MRATTKFKSLLSGGQIVVAPGAFDGLSARLVEQTGFPAVYASGGAIARSTGVPDMGLITPDEIVQRLAEMVDAVGVPVIADADTGFGGTLNVMRTVRELERAGVAFGRNIWSHADPAAITRRLVDVVHPDGARR